MGRLLRLRQGVQFSHRAGGGEFNAFIGDGDGGPAGIAEVEEPLQDGASVGEEDRPTGQPGIPFPPLGRIRGWYHGLYGVHVHESSSVRESLVPVPA